MNGGIAGMKWRVDLTSGGILVTNARLSNRVWAMIAALASLSCLVNITSSFFIPTAERHYALWEIAVWEGSSNFSLILLAPVFGAAFFRWPYERVGAPRFALTQIGLFVAFSLLHIVMMVVLRKLAYALVHDSYDFSHGQPLLKLLYEARKDAVTYGIFLTFFWLDQRWRTPALAPVTADAAPSRLDIKVDGRTVYLDPAEILWLEAAGNYVELHMTDKNYLVRGALTAFEDRLSPHGFLRIHRSRLVRRASIREQRMMPSGDVEFTLNGGHRLMGSRRRTVHLHA
jgi:hypothetical protein